MIMGSLTAVKYTDEVLRPVDIFHCIKLPLIVITGSLTAVKYTDEVLRPVAISLLCSNVN